MATEIFEDTLDLQIPLLEAEPIEPGPAYPMPRLRPLGQSELRTFRVYLLENPYLRVTVVPALGGRILSLFDKRTGVEILRRHATLALREEGRRGVILPEGIQLRLDGEDRLNALGNVASVAEEGEDADAEGAIWLAETSMANGLGFHLRLSLPPDRAELRIEARILNRTFHAIPYDGEIAVYLGEGAWQGNAFYSPSRDAGVAVFGDRLFDGVRVENGTLRFARFGENRELGPRQVDVWNVSLVPLSGLGGVSAASSAAAAHFGADALKIQASRELHGQKLVLLTEQGQTLEAPADLYPEHALEIAYASLPSRPVSLVLLGPDREEVLRADRASAASETPPSLPRPTFHWNALPESPTRADLSRLTFEVPYRHLAHTQLAILSLREDDLTEADASFESALAYNADDPLLWWGKALAARMAGREGEATELLNAHFLAPLEPALRAEAFLTQPLAMGKEANPLLAPLADTPEDFIEVACLLIEHGRLDQASRWIDEALRHRDLAMLRLLMADCLLRGTRMVAEAADHLAAATRIPAPPYPWRATEREALERLHTRFPEHPLIVRMLELAHR